MSGDTTESVVNSALDASIDYKEINAPFIMFTRSRIRHAKPDYGLARRKCFYEGTSGCGL